MPPTRLWVGNVPYNSTQDELETLFLRHGKITNISYREGFSFIDFETEDEAHEAKSKLHDTNYQGRRLQVEFARSDGPRARGERHDGPPPEDESGSRHLYVARIPEAVSVDELRDFFAVNGNVLNVKMLPQKGEFKSAFVDFEHPAEAAAAFRSSAKLHGATLRLDYNHRTPRPPHAGARGIDGPGGYERGGRERLDDRYGAYGGREREYGYERGGGGGGYERGGGGYGGGYERGGGGYGGGGYGGNERDYDYERGGPRGGGGYERGGGGYAPHDGYGDRPPMYERAGPAYERAGPAYERAGPAYDAGGAPYGGRGGYDDRRDPYDGRRDPNDRREPLPPPLPALYAPPTREPYPDERRGPPSYERDERGAYGGPRGGYDERGRGYGGGYGDAAAGREYECAQPLSAGPPPDYGARAPPGRSSAERGAGGYGGRDDRERDRAGGPPYGSGARPDYASDEYARGGGPPPPMGASARGYDDYGPRR